MLNNQVSDNNSSSVFINGWIQNIPWRLHLIVSAVGFLMIVTMGYGFYHGNYLIEKYTPLIDATMEIKLQATTAHLWFEEIVSGDRDEDINEVNKLLDESQWYARAMLQGGENPEGKFLPLTDPVLISEIEKVSAKIDLFRKITDERHKAVKQSGPGTKADKQYDAVFDDFISQADKVESRLQADVNTQIKILKVLQVLLIIISLGSLAAIVLVLHHYDRRRTSDMQLIRETNENLQKALDEVKNLQGIIPICGYCKKIRDEEGLWNQLEVYVHNHSDAKFSHGICPECMKKFREEAGIPGKN